MPDSRASWRPIWSRDLLHPAAEDARVRARKVDVLEDAARLRQAARILAAGHAVLQTPSPVRRAACRAQTRREADRRRRTRRRRQWCRGRLGIFHAPHREWTKAARIACGENAVARHHDNRERAFNLRERVGDAVHECAGLGVRDELDDDFGIGSGLEIRAVALQPGAQDCPGSPGCRCARWRSGPWSSRREWAAHSAAPSRRWWSSACGRSP